MKKYKMSIGEFKKLFWKKENKFYVLCGDFWFSIKKGELRSREHNVFNMHVQTFENFPNQIYITSIRLK